MIAASDAEIVARWLARRAAVNVLGVNLSAEMLELLKGSINEFENEYWLEFREEARRLLGAGSPNPETPSPNSPRSGEIG
jgi:hypothetical protein